MADSPAEALIAENLVTDSYSMLRAIENHQGPISVPKLAQLWDVTPKAIYGAITKGVLPTLDIGLGVKRFDPASLAYWLRKRNPILVQAERGR